MIVPCVMAIRSLFAVLALCPSPPPSLLPLLPPLLSLVDVVLEELEDVELELVVEEDVEAWTKGFNELPPRAFLRSRLKESKSECCCRFVDLSLDLMGEPSLTAQIQEVEAEVRSMLPPDHLAQLEPVMRKVC